MEEDNEVVKPDISEENSISMLRKDLYARKESDALLKRSEDLFTPKQPVVLPESKVESQPDLVDAMSGKMQKRKKIAQWGLISIAGLAVFVTAVAGTMWYRGTQQVNVRQVGATIAAPSNFIAGGNITYTVTVTNNSHVNWGAVNVSLVPSSGFIYASSEPSAQVSVQDISATLPALASGKSETFVVQGQLLGDQGSSASMSAKVSVSPVKFPKVVVQNSASVSTVLSAIPLEISVEAAKNASVGQRISAVVHIRNLGDVVIKNAVLKLSPDPGMELATEDSGFSPNFSVIDSYWNLPEIKPLDTIDLYAVLYVQGNIGDTRTLGIAINTMKNNQTFTLRSIAQVVTVSASQLGVAQTFNNTSGDKLHVDAGQNIDAVVSYTNVGTTGITDAIIKVNFAGSGLNASSLKLSSGSYDPVTHSITWTAASIPALKQVLPGQSGKIAYSFSVLPYDQFPLTGSGKNQQIVVTASLDSPDLPSPTGQARQIISDRFIMPVRTGIILQADAVYDDGRSGLISSGPLPPQVGQTTTYTVRTKVGSTLNDVQASQVTIVLPDGVTYADQYYKTAGLLDYNQRTNTIVWKLDSLKGLTGRTLPLEELDIQVSITPGADKKGQEVPFAQGITASGKDSFTNDSVSAKVSAVPTTRTASPQNGDVQ